VLGSERGLPMPPLADALARFLLDGERWAGNWPWPDMEASQRAA
jgi:hypothetical protein